MRVGDIFVYDRSVLLLCTAIKAVKDTQEFHYTKLDDRKYKNYFLKDSIYYDTTLVLGTEANLPMIRLLYGK